MASSRRVLNFHVDRVIYNFRLVQSEETRKDFRDYGSNLASEFPFHGLAQEFPHSLPFSSSLQSKF